MDVWEVICGIIAMLALSSLAVQAFSAPTVHVAQPVVRSSPVQMMEMPSRRATLLTAASLLAVPLAAQAKPEDYAGGYTTKLYEKTYEKSKENPGGSPKDPRIFFKAGDPPVAAPKAAPKEEPKKEEEKKA